MACCSSCNYTPCSCATITGEADAPQCLPPGSEVALDSVGGFDEFNCPRALNPFRGFDSKGDPITLVTTPTEAAFLFQDSTGNVCWTDRPKVVLPEQQIGLATVSTTPATTNSIPNLVGVDATGQWREIAARTGQTASTVKWNPTTGFTLKPDTADQQGVCTTLTNPVNIAIGQQTYNFTVASTAVFAQGLSVLVNTKEYIVQSVISPTLMSLKAVDPPTADTTILAGVSVCGVGFKPVSGIASSYVDTLTGSVTTGGVTTSNSLTFPPETVAGKKIPGLFWRDQAGQVSFLAAPVDGSGLIVPNQILKTPSTVSSATNAPNLPTFVPAPGGYTWLASPYQIAAFSQIASSSPVNGTFPYDVSSTPGFVAGSKAVILDIQLLGATNTQTYKTVVSINGLSACAAYLGSSFSTVTDTNQLIVPIVTSTSLSMLVTTVTYNAGTYSNWSLIVKVVGFIG